MVWRLRSLWAAAGVVLYLCAAAIRAHPHAPAPWIALLAGPALLLLGWKLVDVPVRGLDGIDPAARSSARVVVTGAVAALVTLSVAGSPSFVAARTLAVGAASVASMLAIVRVGSLGGIAVRPNRRRPLDAAVFTALLWTIAVGLAAVRAIAPTRTRLLDSLAVDYGAVAASLGSIGIGIVATLRVHAQRRYELGVAERAAAALWLSVLGLAIGVLASLMSVARPETIVPLSALGAALGLTAAATSQRPAVLSRMLRTAASLTLLCAPVVFVAVVAAYKAPTHAGLVMFFVTIAAASLGLVAPTLAARLAPERGRWLETLDAANRAARLPVPDRAVAGVLVALRDGLGRDVAKAELFRIASGDRLTVDRAGYVHVELEDVPGRLLALADAEPYGVLSTESLRTAEVRRPDVREVVQWLDVRAMGAAIVVPDEDVSAGLLLWPAAGRTAPLSTEEVQQMRRLAEHLGAAIGAESQLARSRARELSAEQEVARAVGRADGLERRLESAQARHRLVAEQLAVRARQACYSAAAQEALTATERLGASGRPLSLVTPPGVDAPCWAAVAHVASPRRGSVFLQWDTADRPAAAQSVTDALAEWADSERSPLEIARDGTLVLLDPQLLAHDVQRYVAQARGERTGLVLVVPAPVELLVHRGLLDPHLAATVDGREVSLPALVDRPEDLRALALVELGRLGLRLRGEPMGLTMRAQALLNEHSWPANEQELRAVLQRAALRARGPVVDRAELAAGFERIGDELDAAAPGPQRAVG